jgi:Tfp pilus assembly protein FimT
MIEVVMVIVILGVLAAIAAVNYSTVPSARLTAAANKLKADMQYAQTLAMNTNEDCGVTFSGNTYTVFENDNTADPAADPLTKQDYTVTFNAGRFLGITITSATFGATTVLKFDREGSPEDGSGNALPSAAASRRVVLTNGTNSTNVTVNQTTGTVLIE